MDSFGFATAPVCVHGLDMTSSDPCSQCAPGWDYDRTLLRIAHCNMPEYFSVVVDSISILVAVVCLAIAGYWILRNSSGRPFKVRSIMYLSFALPIVCIVLQSVHLGYMGTSPLYFFFSVCALTIIITTSALMSELYFEVCERDLCRFNKKFKSTRLRRVLNLFSVIWIIAVSFTVFASFAAYPTFPAYINYVFLICDILYNIAIIIALVGTRIGVNEILALLKENQEHYEESNVVGSSQRKIDYDALVKRTKSFRFQHTMNMSLSIVITVIYVGLALGNTAWSFAMYPILVIFFPCHGIMFVVTTYPLKKKNTTDLVLSNTNPRISSKLNQVQNQLPSSTS
jgi:hypothetical protein